jgi:hypothetical protein
MLVVTRARAFAFVLITGGSLLACATPRLAQPSGPGSRAPSSPATGASQGDPGDAEIVVTSIEPASGAFLGGTRVTVNGRNFPAGGTLEIGGVETQAEVTDATTIVGRTGTHTPGRADVVVKAPDGRRGTLAGGFRYTRQDPTEANPDPPPLVRRVEPMLGPASGGTIVTLTGTHFARGSTVTFNGVAASRVTVRNPTTIEAVTPRGDEGPAEVVVVNPGGRSGRLTAGYRYFRLRTRTAEPAEPVGGTTRFIDATERAGVGFRHSRDSLLMPLGGGAAVGDFNNDGLLDIFVTNSAGRNALYRNNGDGTFSDVADALGVAGPLRSAYGAGWADYDNDGHLDLFVAAYGESRLYRNEGPPSFRFTDVTQAAGVGDPDGTYRTSGVAWGDFDGDGFLDLLVVRHLDESDPGVFFHSPRNLSTAVRSLALYRNNGNGTFTDVTHLLGDASLYPSNVKGAGFTPAFVDYNNDGRLDVYVVNDFGVFNHPNVLWRNDGPDGRGGWRFTDVSRESGADLAIYGMGLAIGDYNNDGHLSFYMSDIGPSKLLRNQGNGTFAEVAEAAGVGRGVVPDPGFPDNRSVGWGVAFFDFDNDGWLDLYLVAGFMDAEPATNLTHQPNALFRNRADGTFEDVSAGSGVDDAGAGREVAVADFDGDGRLDLFVVNIGTRAQDPGVSHLYLNRTPEAGNWLAVKPVGTRSNRDGIGTRIEVRAGGLTRVGVMGARQGHVSHSVVPVHFGVGAATQAEVIVRWPGGAVQTYKDVAVKQLLTVVEP